MSFTRSCWRVYVFHNYHGFMSAVVYQSLYMYNVVYFRTEFCWDRYRIPGIWVCVWYSGTRRYTGIEINQVSCRNHSEWGIMTSLILCVLRSGEVASLDNTHKSNDVIMTSRSYHVTITSSPLPELSCEQMEFSDYWSHRFCSLFTSSCSSHLLFVFFFSLGRNHSTIPLIGTLNSTDRFILAEFQFLQFHQLEP